jgi:hypothetical protein
MTIDAEWFTNSTVKTVELLARQTVRVDTRLEIGVLEGGRIDVTASIGVITTESATIADSKSGREINELAVNFRATENTSPLVVASLAPGVQKDRNDNLSISGMLPYTTSEGRAQINLSQKFPSRSE